jgi:carbamoyl-phosphate synthase large subunit
MKSLLILGASEIQLPVIQECKRLGHKAIVADYNRDSRGMQVADLPLAISTNDVSAVLDAARKLAVDGILTTSDYPVRTVARVCKELGLSGLSEQAATLSTDKFLQRQMLCAEGLLCPDYVLLENAERLHELTARIAFPAIVKPVDSSASRGVSRVDSASELEAAYSLARSFSRNGNVLIEEFITGPEYSVEVLIQDSVIHIVTITEKTISGDGHRFFVENRHIVPAPLSEDDSHAIRDTVRKAVTAAGLNNCASHTEVKLSPKGPVIVEIAARLGGDFITSDLVPLATGVSMLENIIKIALGEPFHPQPLYNRFSGIQFVTPDSYTRAVAHFEHIRNDARIHRLEIHPKPEGAVLQSSFDRLGYCIAVCETRQQLLSILEF